MTSGSIFGVKDGNDARVADPLLPWAAARASAKALLPEEEIEELEPDFSLLTTSSGASTNRALLLSDVEVECFLL